MSRNLSESLVVHGSILESKQGLPDGVLSRIIYPIAYIGKKNKNGRVYRREVWDKVADDKRVSEALSNRNMWMQEEHPPEEDKQNKTVTSRIAGVVTALIFPWKGIPAELQEAIQGKVDIDKDTAYAVQEVLDTPMGRIIDTLIRAKCGLGISTRANGDIKEAQNESGETVFDVVPDSYQFLTIDFTATPSTDVLPLHVEQGMTSQIKEGVASGKVGREFAVKLLETMKAPEAVALCESLKLDGKVKKAPKLKINMKRVNEGGAEVEDSINIGNNEVWFQYDARQADGLTVNDIDLLSVYPKEADGSLGDDIIATMSDEQKKKYIETILAEYEPSVYYEDRDDGSDEAYERSRDMRECIVADMMKACIEQGVFENDKVIRLDESIKDTTKAFSGAIVRRIFEAEGACAVTKAENEKLREALDAEEHALNLKERMIGEITQLGESNAALCEEVAKLESGMKSMATEHEKEVKGLEDKIAGMDEVADLLKKKEDVAKAAVAAGKKAAEDFVKEKEDLIKEGKEAAKKAAALAAKEKKEALENAASEIQKAVGGRIGEMAAKYDNEIKRLQEAHVADLERVRAIERRIVESGIEFDAADLVHLRAVKTVNEADELISEKRMLLRENWHGAFDMTLVNESRVEEPADPVVGQLAKLISGNRH